MDWCPLILLAYVCWFICAVWSSTGILFRLKFLSNLCIPKPASETRFWRPSCSFHTSYKLALFSFETIKKNSPRVKACFLFLFCHGIAVVIVTFQFFDLTWECIAQIK